MYREQTFQDKGCSQNRQCLGVGWYCLVVLEEKGGIEQAMGTIVWIFLTQLENLEFIQKEVGIQGSDKHNVTWDRGMAVMGGGGVTWER